MPRPKGKKYNDLSGKRLGKLLVIERDFSKDYPRPYFLCKCDCGKTKTICSSNLTRSTRPSIDNKKGYELDNCVPCCKLCNRMKAALTMGEFLEQIKYIYQENLLWEEE